MSNQINDAISVKSVATDNHFKTRQKESPTDTNSSHVSLRSTSKQLEVIKNSLKGISEINEARVLYLKSEIALGNYKIDCDKIAMRLMDLEPA